MFKSYISVQRRHIHRILLHFFFLLFFEEFKDTLRGSRGRLHHVADLGQLGDRLGKVSYILDKGLDLPYLNGILDCQKSSQNRNDHIA